MNKKSIGLIIVAIIVIAGIGYWIYQSFSAPEGIIETEAENCENDSDCVVFGEDGDCNCGCFNKNHQWEKEGDCFCAAPKLCKCVEGKCEGVFEENKETAIKNLFAEKYDKDVSEITISIIQETEDHIKGEVQFEPGDPGNLGGFLVAKKNGDSELVYDGNGIIFCSAIESYNFPVDMVIECWNEETQEPKDRAGEACVNSGGEITTSLCCKMTSDYPNLCLIGACGCSPDNSHEVRICDCESEKCFNGKECVQFEK